MLQSVLDLYSDYIGGAVYYIGGVWRLFTTNIEGGGMKVQHWQFWANHFLMFRNFSFKFYFELFLLWANNITCYIEYIRSKKHILSKKNQETQNEENSRSETLLKKRKTWLFKIFFINIVFSFLHYMPGIWHRWQGW